MSGCVPDRRARNVLGASDVKPLLRRVKLGGRLWSLVSVIRALIPGTHGLCYEDERIIYVSDVDKGEDALDTVIHEALHAQMPWLDEGHVRRCGAELARMLWRLGYRRSA